MLYYGFKKKLFLNDWESSTVWKRCSGLRSQGPRKIQIMTCPLGIFGFLLRNGEPFKHFEKRSGLL